MNLTFVFHSTPDLYDAACRGHHHLFDAQHADEDRDSVITRHDQALAICARCPVIDACTDYANTLTVRERGDSGILAGRRPYARLHNRKATT